MTFYRRIIKISKIFINGASDGLGQLTAKTLIQKGAPGTLESGYETLVWLATSNDENAKVSGRYFDHMKETRYNSEADDPRLQERFLKLCEEITGVSFKW